MSFYLLTAPTLKLDLIFFHNPWPNESNRSVFYSYYLQQTELLTRHEKSCFSRGVFLEGGYTLCNFNNVIRSRQAAVSCNKLGHGMKFAVHTAWWKRNSWCAWMVQRLINCHHHHFGNGDDILFQWLVDAGRGSSHTVSPCDLTPNFFFYSCTVGILFQAIFGCNSHPRPCLTVWCRTTISEPRPKILPAFSRNGYLSPWMAKSCAVWRQP